MSSPLQFPMEDITLYDFMFNGHDRNDLDDRDDTQGDQVWFLDATTHESLTRRQVRARTDALAIGLQIHFYSKLSRRTFATNPGLSSVVSLVTPNDIDFGTVVWACHKLGYTVAPSNATVTIDELVHQLRLTQASFIVAHPSALDRVLAAASQVGLPEDHIIALSRSNELRVPLMTLKNLIDSGTSAIGRGEQLRAVPALPLGEPRIAFLCFSSGTTGLPKAVVIPHKAVIANIIQVSHSGCLRPRSTDPAVQDKALGVIPISHMYGLLTLLHLCPYLGITSTLFASMPGFGDFLDAIERLQINHLFLAPPLVHAFIKHPSAKGRNFSFFKTCLVAAAPLDSESEEKFRSLVDSPNFMINQAFGMTETAGLITGPGLGISPRHGSVGQLMPMTEAKLIDSSGVPVNLGTGQARGELLIRGPQVCLGYLNNEKATRETFESDGYIRTGDEVEIDEHGTMYIVDRIKSIIKCKGFQVSPSELEGQIRQHACVRDVAVIGKSDPRCGEVPVALVVLSDVGTERVEQGIDVKESIALHVREKLSQYKWLAEVRYVDTIPKLPSGKILSRELKKLVQDSLRGSAQPEDEVSSPTTPQAAHFRHSSAETAITFVGSEDDSRRNTLIESKGKYAANVDIEKAISVLEREQGPLQPIAEERPTSFYEKKADAAATPRRRFREWLSLYRIMFFTLVSINLVGVVFTFAHKWSFAQSNGATITLCYITVGILVRNELALRCLYAILLFCFRRWTPFLFRNAISTFLLHIGGLHSGFALSGTMWLLATTVELLRNGMWSHPRSNAAPWLSVLAVLVTVIVTAVCVAAHPAIRERHHNCFERIHRFAGWTALGLLWVFIGVADAWDPVHHDFYASRIKRRPHIYIVVALTVIIFLPWTTMRKVPVKAEVLSNSVVLLRFEGYIRRGLFGRVSRNPFSENHAFGITSKVPEYQPEKGEHYMCVVGQGDFTRGLIVDPPTYMWTRTMKFTGLPIMTSFYRSGLYVVTGSAIGVALSIFMQRDPKSRWHLLWIAGNIEKTYGGTVLPDLRQAYEKDENGRTFENSVTVWDTRKRGRPDMMTLIEMTVRTNNCEVVFVTSNPKGTADILRGCAERRIPCHGPIWDS